MKRIHEKIVIFGPDESHECKEGNMAEFVFKEHSDGQMGIIKARNVWWPYNDQAHLRCQSASGENQNNEPENPNAETSDGAALDAASCWVIEFRDGDYIKTNEKYPNEYKMIWKGSLLNEGPKRTKPSIWSFLKTKLFGLPKDSNYDVKDVERPQFYIPHGLLKQRIHRYEERPTIQ